MDKYMVANLTKEYCIKHEKTMNKCQLLLTKYVKPTQKSHRRQLFTKCGNN